MVDWVENFTAPIQCTNPIGCAHEADDVIDFEVDGYVVMRLTSDQVETFVPVEIGSFALEVGR